MEEGVRIVERVRGAGASVHLDDFRVGKQTPVFFGFGVNSLRLAKNVDGNRVDLVDTPVNLQLAQERWPKLAFHDTREHGEVMG